MERPPKPDEGRIQEKRERPKLLYHSSHNPQINEFAPRQERVRDIQEGPVVFATPSEAYASMFLIPRHFEKKTRLGFYNHVPVAIICADTESFIRHDSGGFLYALPGDTFDFDPQRNMGEREWTSKVPVKPVAKIQYPSALEVMIEKGVQVYFVDEESFRRLTDEQEDGIEILSDLISENQKRSKNVISFSEALKK